MNADVESESKETELIQTDLTVITTHKNEDVDLFNENYQMWMHPNFLNLKDVKRYNITNHARWFKNKIKLNHLMEEIEPINKRKICIIDFGMNIGTEINGIRPVIVYKSSTYKYWEDMIVMPITSFYDESWEEKSQDALDVILEADLENGIDHKSLVKIRQLRCVSKKRLRRDKKSWIIKILGSIVNDDIKREINGNIKKMFGLDGNDN